MAPNSSCRSAQALAVALAFTLLGPAGPALSEPSLTTGEIAEIDTVNRKFSLENGQVFLAGDKIKLSRRAVGEKVIVVYESRDGMKQALKVRRVPAALESFIPSPGPQTLADDGNAASKQDANGD